MCVNPYVGITSTPTPGTAFLYLTRDARCPGTGPFGGSEEDEEGQVLFDVVEPMVHEGRHEDDRTRTDRTFLRPHADLRVAPDDVVDFVLGMGALPVRIALREFVQSTTHRRHSAKLKKRLRPGIKRPRLGYPDPRSSVSALGSQSPKRGRKPRDRVRGRCSAASS